MHFGGYFIEQIFIKICSHPIISWFFLWPPISHEKILWPPSFFMTPPIRKKMIAPLYHYWWSHSSMVQTLIPLMSRNTLNTNLMHGHRSSKGDFFRVKVKCQRSRVKGQRSQVTSGSFFVLTTSGSFFVLTTSGSFFVLTTSGSVFVLIFFRVDHFRIFFRGGHSLAYFVNIHERGGGRYHKE